MKTPNHIILSGWIASFCFMFSALPAAYEAFSTSHSPIHSGTLSLWTVGEICAIIYVSERRDIPLLANYITNLIFISILWYFKFF